MSPLLLALLAYVGLCVLLVAVRVWATRHRRSARRYGAAHMTPSRYAAFEYDGRRGWRRVR